MAPAADVWDSCKAGDAEVVKKSLGVVGVNAINSQGWTLLSIACNLGHVDTARMLIQEGAKINGIRRRHGGQR